MPTPPPSEPGAGRRWIAWTALVAVVVIFAGWVWWWPTTEGDRHDVVVIGDGAVAASKDELARRLRQEGMEPVIVVLDAADCADATTHLGDAAESVVSFSDWTHCPDHLAASLAVQQPGGPLPSSALGTVRPAAPLFGGGDTERCRWWDTPGAGEDRPGLGQCSGNSVTVLDQGTLTPAGRERFARMVAEAVK